MREPFWEITVNGDQSEFEGSPTVVGDRVYVGTTSGVRGYSVSNGDLTMTGPDTGAAATPRVRDDTLYTIKYADTSPGLEELSASDSVVSLDPTDGTVTGETSVSDGIAVRYPTVVDGVAFVAVEDVQFTSNDYYFRAVDVESGERLWQEQTNDAAAPPTVAGGKVYAADDGFGGATGYAFEASSGDLEWSASLDDGYDDAVPVITDDTALFGGTAIDATTGTEQWRSDQPLQTPTVADGTVFALDADSDGTLYALDLGDGSEQWSSPVETGGSTDTSAPTVAGNSVFVSSDDGLISVSAETGEIQWRANLGAPVTSPVVVDGVVFALTSAGRLAALPSDVAGSSRGARVRGGVHNHHHEWANVDEPDLPATLTITPESVSLRNVPVERGGSANDPIVQIAGVTDADSISLEATYDDSGTEQTETFDFEAIDASAEAVDQQSVLTQVSLDTGELDPGTWVDLEVTDGGGETVVDSLAIDHPEDGWLLEGDDLGYHVFETVEDVRFVLGTFEDQTIETADLRALAEARVRDVNYFLGSPRGLLGDVGLNVDVTGVDRGGYTVEPKESYDGAGVKPFTDDLQAAYTSVQGESPGAGVALWIALQLGDRIAPSGTSAGVKRGLYMSGKDRVYVNQSLPWPNPTRVSGTFFHRYAEGLYHLAHEIGHAYGLAHTSQNANGSVARSCLMNNTPTLSPRHKVAVENTEVPFSAFSVIPQLSVEIGTDRSGGEYGDIGTTRDLLSAEPVTANELPSEHSVRARTGPETDPRQVSVPVINAGNARYAVELRRYIDGTSGSKFDWGTNNLAGVLIYRIGESVSISKKFEQVKHLDALPDPVTNSVICTTEFSRPQVELVEGWAASFPRGPGPDKLAGGEQHPFLFELDAPEDETYTQFEVGDVTTDDAGGVTAATVSAGNEILDELADKVVLCLDVEAGPPVATYYTEDGVPAQSTGWCGNCVGGESVSASLNLKVRDSQGRLVGQMDDGQYVTEIPGAIASGPRENGVEWIAMPADTDIDVRVDTSEVEPYLREIIDIANDGGAESDADEVLAESTVEYTIAETQYDDSTEVATDEGEELRVPGATTRVQQQTVQTGDQRDATIANPESEVDLVDIQQATVETSGALTFRNLGEEQLDLDGWLLIVDQNQTYTFPENSLEPDAELTLGISGGSDTEQDLNWETDATVPSPDGGLVELRTSDDETALKVVYDSRGRIRYDQQPTAENEDGDGTGDVRENGNGIDTLTVVAMLGGASAAGYALKRHLR